MRKSVHSHRFSLSRTMYVTPTEDMEDRRNTTLSDSAYTPPSVLTVDHLDQVSQPDEFVALRMQCDKLIASEHVDKSVALGILKLLHAAETMMLELRFAKDQEASSLRHELNVLQMTNRNADMMNSLTVDVSAIKEALKRAQAELQILQQGVQMGKRR